MSEDEIAHRDKMQKLRQDLSDANVDINDTNKALDALAATLRREPQLKDYYTPSPEMERFQMITNGIVGLGAGWVGYKAYKYMSKRK